MKMPAPSILILYDPHSLHTSAVREQLNAFRLYSGFRIFYAAGVGDAECFVDFDAYDAVMIHYSVRVALGFHISPRVDEKLRAYQGLKLCFVQDEYDRTEHFRRYVDSRGVDVVFTCVPEEHISRIYPHESFRKTVFVNVLTGYVPIRFQNGAETRPSAERDVIIGHRGRRLPFQYGDLGQEKYRIGVDVLAAAKRHNIKVDIEWEENKRVYGDAWYNFVGAARCTLGTESGSNVFDEHGMISESVAAYVKKHPHAKYREVKQECFPGVETPLMNQISTRAFEAIALKTGLILYEGHYSGILEADTHFIALKKDMSNIRDVFERACDAVYVQEIVDRAYADVIESGRWTYERFIERFDRIVINHLGGEKLRAPQVPQEIAAREALIAEPAPMGPVVHTMATTQPLGAPDMSKIAVNTGPIAATAPPLPPPTAGLAVRVAPLLVAFYRYVPSPLRRLAKQIVPAPSVKNMQRVVDHRIRSSQ